MGEDFDLINGNGFRNMAHPTAEGDPDNYADRYTGTSDNGGVHINSGIPNYAFSQLVEVEGVGIQRAADIFFDGFSLLTENADFCDAREATIAVASTDEGAVTAAWDHVGVDAGLCDGGTATPMPPSADFSSVCTNLSCSFTDNSTDGGDGGAIVAWSWDFESDGSEDSDGQNPSHLFPAEGTYPVSLTVTDDAGLSDTVTKDVTVSDGSSGGGVTLGVSPFKVKGERHAWLSWNIQDGGVEIYVDGQHRETVDASLGTDAPGYDLTIGGKGGGTFMIKVCEAGGTSYSCSGDVPAIF